MTLEPWNPGPLRSLNTLYPQHPRNIDTTATGEERGGEGGGCRESYVSGVKITQLFLPSRRHPGFGAQGRLRISVDVAGSGWSEGKRMSVRAMRKVGHP